MGDPSVKKKNVSVFDFDEADLSAETPASKYVPLKPKPKENGRVTRSDFYTTFTGGQQQADATNLSHRDLCGNAPKRPLLITSPNRRFPLEEKSELEEIMASSTSSDEKSNSHIDDCDQTYLVTTASTQLLPAVGNRHDLEESPLNEISDDEESSTTINLSPWTSASNLVEDEDYDECPRSDNFCTTFVEKDNGDRHVTVSPHFVMYGKDLYGEASIIFSPDTVMFECSDLSEKTEKLILEFAVADITHVHCQFSVDSALIKFCSSVVTLNKKELVQVTCDVEQLIFSVSDVLWQEMEKKIKSLATKYNNLWNAFQYDDLVLGESNRKHDNFFQPHYFLQIPDTFDEVIYPKGDPDAVSITKRDIEQLQPNTFLNDTIIDFYIKNLKSRIQPNEKHRFHFFNSFFFRKLADLDKNPGSASEGRAAFLRVRKWTRKIDIFEKDYIFIPVNFSLHWSLLVICHPGEVAISSEDSPKVPCILHMDSIKGCHSGLENHIRSYLWEEWKERNTATEEFASKFSNLRFVPLELPQQENSFDCGLFLLHYVELFVEEAPSNFSPLMITKFSKFLSLDWFPPSEASFKRYIIKKLIFDLIDTSTSRRVVSNSLCFDADVENQRNCVTASSADVSLCDKQEGLLLMQLLESKITTVVHDHDVNAFQDNGPRQILKIPKCHPDEAACGSEELLSSSLKKNHDKSFGLCPAQQICSASYCLDGKTGNETTSKYIEEKELGIALLPTSWDNDHLGSSPKVETGNCEKLCIEDCGYAADSPTSSFGKNLQCNFEGIAARKTKGSCQIPDKNKDTTEATSASSDECQEIDTREINAGSEYDESQENAPTKSEDGDVTGISQQEDSNEQNIESDGECQEVSILEAKVGVSENPKEISKCKAFAEDATETQCTEVEEVQVIYRTKDNVANSEVCLEAKLSRAAVKNAEDSKVVRSSVEEVVDIADCKIIHTVEDEDSSDKNRQEVYGNSVVEGQSFVETKQMPLLHAIVIADDEQNEGVGKRELKRDRPPAETIIYYRKRPKFVSPGERRYTTRSQTKDAPS